MRGRHWVRVAVYVPLLGMLGWLLPGLIDAYTPFVPPDVDKRQKAIGSLNGLPSRLKGVFQETASFDAIPEPGPGDWLMSMGRMDRRGQSVGQFKRGWRNDVTEARRTLCILPCDPAFRGQEALLESFAAFMGHYFQLPVRVMETLDLASRGVTSRENNGALQWLTGDVLDLLTDRVPKDAYSLIALTLTDLYPKESWNFVFGQASLKDRVGVFSLARYFEMLSTNGVTDFGSVDAKFMRRAFKVLAHETGHMFGIHHCIHYRCLLNGSGSLSETDRAPLHACPLCLRKLHLAIGFDPIRRYQSMQSFYEEHDLDLEASWIDQRLDEITQKSGN